FRRPELRIAEHRLGLAANLCLKNVVERRGRVDGTDLHRRFGEMSSIEAKRSRNGGLTYATFAQNQRQGHVQCGPSGSLEAYRPASGRRHIVFQTRAGEDVFRE